MEVLRDQVTESAANTFTQREIQTPVSRSEKLAMLIWKIQIWPDIAEEEDTQDNSVIVQLTKSTATAVVVPEDDDLVFRWRHGVRAGVNAGTLSEYLIERMDPQVATFQPPLLYAKSSIFLGIVGSGNSAAKAVGCHVYYTLERIPDALFIAALVE